jgi:hypothetical protein
VGLGLLPDALDEEQGRQRQAELDGHDKVEETVKAR